MKTKHDSNGLQNHVADRPRVKTLDLRLGVTERRLADAVKRSFDLAKSAGRELDVLFHLEPN